MSHEVLNEALAAPGSNGTCTVSYSGLLYHSTYMPISRAAVRKSDPDTSFLDTSCLSTLYGVPVLRSRTRTNAADDIRHRYSPLAYFCFFFLSSVYLYFSLFYTPQKKKEERTERFNDEYNVSIRCWNYFSFENVTNLGKIFHYKIALQSSIDCGYLCKFTLFWTQTEKIGSSQKLVSVSKCYNGYHTYFGYLIYFCILLS